MRANQFSVRVSVDGADLGDWDKMEGAESDSEDTLYRPGAMAPAISLGGQSTVAAATISRLYDINRDPGIVHMLRAKTGKGRVTIVKQPLAVDGSAFARAESFTGILKTVTSPEYDSESDDAAMIELQVTLDAVVG